MPIVSGNEDIDHFQHYVRENQEQKNKIFNINMLVEVEKYLQENIEYQKTKLELKSFKLRNIPFGILPSVTANFVTGQQFDRDSLRLEWSVSSIFEYFFKFIYSPEKQKLLNQIIQYRQDGALQVREYFFKLSRLISNIRKTVRQYEAIKEELDRIQSLHHILDENELNEVFYLTEQLLSKELDLYELRNQLEELVNSHPTFYKDKVKKIIDLYIYISNIGINIVSYKISIKNIDRENISYLKSILGKLPVDFVFEGVLSPMIFKQISDFNWSFAAKVNPADYIRYFVDIYYENQIISVENQNRRQKIRSIMLTDMENRQFYSEQVVKSSKVLSYTEQLLHNEDKMKKVKAKRILKLRLELIAREEDLLLFQVLIFLQDLVKFV